MRTQGDTQPDTHAQNEWERRLAEGAAQWDNEKDQKKRSTPGAPLVHVRCGTCILQRAHSLLKNLRAHYTVNALGVQVSAKAGGDAW